jgi:hypothetical protein
LPDLWVLASIVRFILHDWRRMAPSIMGKLEKSLGSQLRIIDGYQLFVKTNCDFKWGITFGQLLESIVGSYLPLVVLIRKLVDLTGDIAVGTQASR